MDPCAIGTCPGMKLLPPLWMWTEGSPHGGDPHSVGGTGMGWAGGSDLLGLVAASRLVEGTCLALILFYLQ